MQRMSRVSDPWAILTALLVVVVEVVALHVRRVRVRVRRVVRARRLRRAVERQRGRVRPLDGRGVARRHAPAAHAAAALASTATTVVARHHLLGR